MTANNEIRAYALSQLGKLDNASPYPVESLAWLQGRVPASMVDMLETLGVGAWGKGKWQTVDARQYEGILRQTLRGDPDFSAEDCTVFAIKGFGDLSCWHRTFGAVNIDVLPNTLSAPAFFDGGPPDPEQAALLAFSTVALLIRDYYDKYAADGAGLFARLLKEHGPLPTGQIFAPRLHPAIGGKMTMENFRSVSAPEGVALLHQMEPFAMMDHRKPKAVKLRVIGRQ